MRMWKSRRWAPPQRPRPELRQALSDPFKAVSVRTLALSAAPAQNPHRPEEAAARFGSKGGEEVAVGHRRALALTRANFRPGFSDNHLRDLGWIGEARNRGGHSRSFRQSGPLPETAQLGFRNLCDVITYHMRWSPEPGGVLWPRKNRRDMRMSRRSCAVQVDRCPPATFLTNCPAAARNAHDPRSTARPQLWQGTDLATAPGR